LEKEEIAKDLAATSALACSHPQFPEGSEYGNASMLKSPIQSGLVLAYNLTILP
jgi:uncharacterized protein (DUF934 family)